MIGTLLLCGGELGDKVVVTAEVDFLTSYGRVSKVFNAETTVVPSYVKPSTVFVNQLGIRTWVLPQAMLGHWVYTWHLEIIDESATSISSVHATLRSASDVVADVSGCVVIAGNNIYPVSRSMPLASTASCQVDQTTLSGTGSFGLGQQLDVVISVTFTNGTISSASTTAVVLPPYALFQ